MADGDSSARVRPGTRGEIGLVNAAIVRVLGLATGGRPNVFTTLARNRGLFRRSLRVEPETPSNRLG